MKKTVLLLVVSCALMANFSTTFTNAPVVQAQAQSSIVSIISTVISFISSFISGGNNGDDEKRAPEPTGSQDCHDDLIYYYKRVHHDNGTMEDVCVGFMETKFGNRLNNPPKDFTYSKQVFYKENNHHARLECTGPVTSSPCTSRSLTCEEQNQ